MHPVGYSANVCCKVVLEMLNNQSLKFLINPYYVKLYLYVLTTDIYKIDK